MIAYKEVPLCTFNETIAGFLLFQIRTLFLFWCARWNFFTGFPTSIPTSWAGGPVRQMSLCSTISVRLWKFDWPEIAISVELFVSPCSTGSRRDVYPQPELLPPPLGQPPDQLLNRFSSTLFGKQSVRSNGQKIKKKPPRIAIPFLGWFFIR